MKHKKDLYGKKLTNKQTKTYGGDSHFGLKQTQISTHKTRNGRDSRFGVKQTDLYREKHTKKPNNYNNNNNNNNNNNKNTKGGDSHFGLKQAQTSTHKTCNGVIATLA